MSSVQMLIDNLVKSRYRSERRLADDLGERQSFINRVAHGKPAPPGLAARIAARAGENPAIAALTAVALQEENLDKRAELVALFGLSLNLTDLEPPTSSKV